MEKTREPWLLDPEVFYLNHGSFGGCPLPVLEEQVRLRNELEARPIEWLAPSRGLIPKLDGAREALCGVVGGQPEDIAFVGNATTAVNAVLRSATWKAGDEVVITDHGYNACSNVVRYLGEREGIVPVLAKLPFPVQSEDEIFDAILESFTDRTRLLLVDHVTSPTALILPVERLVAACHERGVRILVDGAHVPGMLPLDLDALGADYYTGNCHKWLCAPKGCAFLHVRRELQAEVRPAVISHGHNTPSPGRSRFQREFDWPGTYDPTPYLSLPFAIDWLSSQDEGGLRGVMERNHQLALSARNLLCDALGVAPLAPDHMLGAMASVKLPDGAPSLEELDPLHVRLYEHHHIEVPIVHLIDPDRRFIRVSAQLHNDLTDYQALVHALEQEGVC
jgi:isopenicillin-N epimerase